MLFRSAKRHGLKKVYVHCFLDGRDTPPASGKEFVEELEAKMKEIGVGKVATVQGRYYAMDRDNRWERVERAYRALTKGEGTAAQSGPAGIQASYDAEKFDEFVEPVVVMEDGKPVATVQDHDSVIDRSQVRAPEYGRAQAKRLSPPFDRPPEPGPSQVGGPLHDRMCNNPGQSPPQEPPPERVTSHCQHDLYSAVRFSA